MDQLFRVVLGELRQVTTVLTLHHRPSGGVQFASQQGRSQPPFIISLRDLHTKLRSPEDFARIEPIVILEPFLEVVRSEVTSGLVTCAALSAVKRFLHAGLLSETSPDCDDVLELVAGAASHCKFESGSDEQDEVVLMNVLELLHSCLSHPLGERLEDETVYGMIQTCFRISTQSRWSDLLRRLGEQHLLSMIALVFQRNVPAEAADDHASTLSSEATVDSILEGILQETIESERMITDEAVGVVNTQRVQFQPNDVKRVLESGLSICCKIFKFLCSLLDPSRMTTNDNTVLVGLTAINAALEHHGKSLANVPGLMHFIKDDLCRHLLHGLLTDNFLVLASVLRVAVNLFLALKCHVKLQMELFLNKMMEWIVAEGVPYQKQEITVQCFVELCHQPAFMVDLFVNYDCDVRCTDLFSNLVLFLYRNSQPVGGSLYSIHVLALEGLLAILESLTLPNPNAHPSGVVPEVIRKTKETKKLLLEGVQHFNDKGSKEQYIFLQKNGLLPDPLTPHSLARFFRTTPGLNKSKVGLVLGKADDFHQQVLNEYLGTFNMRAGFLSTFRLFLESFKIPGEAQIIQRVLERFSALYYETNKDQGQFETEDAVFLLAYAALILHVDSHNDNVVKKMTEAQFRKTVKGINGTKNFPDDLLTQIYFSVTTQEIKIYEDYYEGYVSASRWKGLIKRARTFSSFVHTRGDGAYNKDIFVMMWGRVISALSTVFSNTYNNDILHRVANGFTLCATISSQYGMSDVLDNVVVTLCRFSTLLNTRTNSQSRINSVINFGANEKAQSATKLVFHITRAYGNHLREGWRSLLDVMLNLRALDLLLPLFELPAFLDPEPVLSSRRENTKAVRGGSGIFGFFFGSGNSTDDEEQVSQQSPQELGDQKVARECILECEVEQLITQSSYLDRDSLVYFAKALILGSLRSHAMDHGSETPPPPGHESASQSTSSSLFCLDTLTQITLTNKNRIMLLWVLVYEHFTGIIGSPASPKELRERATHNLLLLCISLMGKEPAILEQLLKSMQYMVRVNEDHLTPLLCYKFGAASLKLVTEEPKRVLTSALGWVTINSMLRAAVNTPKGASVAVVALRRIMMLAQMDRSSILGKADGDSIPADIQVYAGVDNWTDMMDVLLSLCSFSDNGYKAQTIVDVVPLLEAMYMDSCVRFSENPDNGWRVYWKPILKGLAVLCSHRVEVVRSSAISCLQRLLLLEAMSSLSGDIWKECFEAVLFSLLKDMQDPLGDDPASIEESRIKSFALVAKMLLLNMSKLASISDFHESIWGRMLTFYESYFKIPESTVLREAVMESLKNLLLVLLDFGALKEHQEETFARIDLFAPNLRKELDVLRSGPVENPPSPPKESPSAPK